MTITADAPTITTLTRHDVAALALADGVTFHLYEGQHCVRAHLADDCGTRIYTAREQRLFPDHDGRERRREITTHGHAKGYGTDGSCGIGWHQEERTACFHMIHGSKYDREWQTIAHLLRPGDTLALYWTADNNTEVLREANLHQDELVLEIQRPGHEGHMRFRITRTCSLDNSARMVRRYGY